MLYILNFISPPVDGGYLLVNAQLFTKQTITQLSGYSDRGNWKRFLQENFLKKKGDYIRARYRGTGWILRVHFWTVQAHTIICPQALHQQQMSPSLTSLCPFFSFPSVLSAPRLPTLLPSPVFCSTSQAIMRKHTIKCNASHYKIQDNTMPCDTQC